MAERRLRQVCVFFFPLWLCLLVCLFSRGPHQPIIFFLSLFKGVVTFFIPKFIHYNVVVSTHTHTYSYRWGVFFVTYNLFHCISCVFSYVCSYSRADGGELRDWFIALLFRLYIFPWWRRERDKKKKWKERKKKLWESHPSDPVIWNGPPRLCVWPPLDWRLLYNSRRENCVTCVPQLFTCSLYPSNRVSKCKYFRVTCFNYLSKYDCPLFNSTQSLHKHTHIYIYIWINIVSFVS
jgi:hypothetical protein